MSSASRGLAPREGLECLVNEDGSYRPASSATPWAEGRKVWGPPFLERRHSGLRRPPPAALFLFIDRLSPSVVCGGGASTREVVRGVSSFIPSLSHSHIIDLDHSSTHSDLEK